jgi:hypothetical protein
MTEPQLDEIYTQTCRTMSALGDAKAPLFLARLCLLLIHELDDADRAKRAIVQAAADLAPDAQD